MEQLENFKEINKKTIDNVRLYGSAIVRRAVDEPTCQQVLADVPLESMQRVEEATETIPQQFDTINYFFPNCTPPAITNLGLKLQRHINQWIPMWEPNDVAVQRYSPGEAGIEIHRDYKRDILLVIVISLLGVARFDIQIDEGGQKYWDATLLEPGDVVLLRAPHLTGHPDDRPYHRIHAPLEGQRVSLAYRQNTKPSHLAKVA